MPVPDARSPIFIGGQRRSGTTLLRVLLNRHANIACGPEAIFPQDADFIAWHERLTEEWKERVERYGIGPESVDRSMAALVDNIFTRYQVRQGKQRWAEKTPTNIRRINYLFRLFPQAQFIHVIRDPRDTYCSIRDRATTDKPHWRRFTPERAARDWCKSIVAGKPWRSHPDRYHEVRYEHLVSDPVNTMRELLAFLGEPWDPRVLDAASDNEEAQGANIRRDQVDSSSVGRWRVELGEGEVAGIQAVAGELMREIGYPLEPPARHHSGVT